MAIEFYGNNESTESTDDFDIDLRLSAREESAGDSSLPAHVSRDSNCSTCSHTTPHLCC